MAQNAESLSRALALIQQAHDALAEAASILRNHPDHDDFATAAMRLEAQAGILIAEVKRARESRRAFTEPPVV